MQCSSKRASSFFEVIFDTSSGWTEVTEELRELRLGFTANA
jgi:hypothetical protein